MFRRIMCFCLVFAMAAAFVYLLAPIPVVKALSPGITTWGTTADFDSGNKSDPGTEYFAGNAVDQPSNWIVYPNAASDGTHTFVAYQGLSAPGAGAYSVYAMVHDDSSQYGVWTGPVTVVASAQTGQDGHGSPAIVIAPSGRLLLLCCAHDMDIQVYRSSRAYDISTWGTVSAVTGQNTYPHPIYVGNTLYVLFRGSNLPTGIWKFETSTDEGTTWSAAQSIIDFSALGDSVYVQNVEKYGTRLYFDFVRVDHTTTKRFDLYVAYLETSDSTMRCLPSFNAGTTLDNIEANANCKVVATGTNQTLGGPLHVDPNGNPYVIHATGSTAPEADFVRWTGSSWTAPVNITLLSDFLYPVDFIINGVSNVEAYLTETQFTDGIPSGPYPTSTGGGNMERWTWTGGSWSKAETILSQAHSGSGRPLSRPVVPSAHDDRIRVVFSGRIFYARPNDAKFPGDARMYAWGGSGLVFNPAVPSGNPGVETLTDNARVPSGMFQLSNGLSDTFANPHVGATNKWNASILYNPLAGSDLCVMSISGGIATSATTSDAFQECVFDGTLPVSGDFNVSVKTSTPVQGSNRETNLCLYAEPIECNSNAALFPKQNGVWYRNKGGDQVAAFTTSGGTATQVGSTTTNGADPKWLRITRSGNTFKWLYSGDGSSYTLDKTATFAAPTVLYPMFSCTNNGVTDGTCTFDDFIFQSGTLGASSYRTSGKWVSPSQDTSGLYPRVVTGVYSGATSTYTVNLQIVDSAGFVLDQISSILTSGSTYTWNINPSEANFAISPWLVQVVLSGDGMGSASVDTVTLTTDSLSPYGPGSGTVIPSFIYGPHLTLLDAFSDNLVYFQDNSLIPVSLTPVTYLWDFGDGGHATGSAVSHNFNYTFIATFTVKLLICGGPPGAIQCYSTTRSVTMFAWHILAVVLFIVGSAAGSLYAILYYAKHASLPPRGFVTKRVVYWMRR